MRTIQIALITLVLAVSTSLAATVHGGGGVRGGAAVGSVRGGFGGGYGGYRGGYGGYGYRGGFGVGVGLGDPLCTFTIAASYATA